MSSPLPPEEPPVTRWTVLPIEEVVRLLGASSQSARGPNIVAIDGRSGSGKSSLASVLHRAIPHAAVVHLDDVPSSASWRGGEAQKTILTDPVPEGCSYFDWTERLLENIVLPYRAGQPVHYRPEAWDDWRRPEGATNVPAGCSTLILEGVGAGRRELTHVVDVSIWIQADFEEARRRGIARDGGGAESARLWDRFEAQELPFLAEQAPWERAKLIVAGTPELAYDPASQLVVAKPGHKLAFPQNLETNSF